MALKPPAEKLPLAARKSLRDEWEIVKSNLETKAQDLLGEKYTLEVDMLALYPYAADDSWAKRSPGSMVHNYFEGFIYNLERYTTTYGADGKATFNTVVSQKKITLEVDDVTPKRFSYCGCDIKDGRFRILAAADYLGTNTSDACYEMIKAVEAAEAAGGATGLSVGAKTNVKETVDVQFPELEKAFSKILAYPVKLDGNLEANYKKLKAEKTDFNDAYLGTVTVSYFSSFKDQLTYLKFDGDDMMQESFQEACDKGIIKLEVVDKLVHGSYNDVIFEEGVCKLQMTSNYWWTNVSDIGREVVERL